MYREKDAETQEGRETNKAGRKAGRDMPAERGADLKTVEKLSSAFVSKIRHFRLIIVTLLTNINYDIGNRHEIRYCC
jgi:hypothetical protein